MRVRTRLTLLLLLLSIFVLATAGIFTSLSVSRYLRGRIVNELRTSGEQVDYQLRAILPPGADAYEKLRLYSRSGGFRLTLIGRDGVVDFDSDVREGDLGRLDNHAARPEVAEALRGRIATGTRRSATVDEELFYLARPVIPPLPAGAPFGGAAVIRLSIPLTQVESAATEIRTTILVVAFLVFGVVVVVIGFLSRRLSGPLDEMAGVAARVRAGELDRRIAVRTDDEFGRLGGALNAMIETLNSDIVRLRKLERVRTEFLGNVSHELRTPIFAIQGMLETLLAGAVDDPEVNRDFLGRALDNTKNLNALLNDLIEISRIESGDMKMSFRFFDVTEFLTAVARELAPLGERRAITVGVDAPRGLQVYGDRDRLKQVMVNLIDNAIKYNRDGGRVAVRAVAGGAHVSITVKDTGVGIPPEHLDRIFERFYRVDQERSRVAGGTGLGLAIVKHIVEAHGSAITVESVPGAGTTFSFRLKTTQ